MGHKVPFCVLPYTLDHTYFVSSPPTHSGFTVYLAQLDLRQPTPPRLRHFKELGTPSIPTYGLQLLRRETFLHLPFVAFIRPRLPKTPPLKQGKGQLFRQHRSKRGKERRRHHVRERATADHGSKALCQRVWVFWVSLDSSKTRGGSCFFPKNTMHIFFESKETIVKATS